MLAKSIFRQFSTTAQHTVGFIGLGSMGMPMAGNLVKNGFKVQGYDIKPDVKTAESLGVSLVDQVKDACHKADYVVTCLPKNQHLDAVMFDEGGVMDSARQGTMVNGEMQGSAMVIDVSTVTPMLAQNIGKAAKKQRITFVDSPMAGGTPGAKAGSLVFMVGAETETDFDRAKILLSGMGKKFFYCGGVGTGQIVKISHNLTLGINMIASVEGMILGERLGIDPKVLMQILQSSTSANACMGIYNPRPGNNPNAPSSRNYKDGFQTALIKKDLSLAIAAAESVDASVELAKKAHGYYDYIEEKGHGQKDFGYIYQYLKNDKKL